MKETKLNKIEKIVKERNKEYEKLGFGNYADVDKLVDKTKLGDKEIKRCQFLLDTLEKIEAVLK